jgi:putative transposase
MATRIGGRLHWLSRVLDEHGQTPDVLRWAQRDAAAAERFCRGLLIAVNRLPPDRITTDTLGRYAAALTRMPEMRSGVHLQVRSAPRCDDRVGQAHQPTRARERVMRRFKTAPPARRFLDAFSRVCKRFRPGRHRLGAAVYRATMQERFATWREVAELRAA